MCLCPLENEASLKEGKSKESISTEQKVNLLCSC